MNYQTTYLKACPFCGQRPELGVTLINELGRYTVRCINESCAVGPKVMAREYADAVEKWNKRTEEEAKNTKVISKLNLTDVEVFDVADASRRVYRFENGSWWLIAGPL